MTEKYKRGPRKESQETRLVEPELLNVWEGEFIGADQNLLPDNIRL